MATDSLPNYSWLQFPASYISDIDFLALSDAAVSLYVKIYLLALKADAEGLVASERRPYTVKDLAWQFRKPEDEISATLEELSVAGFVVTEPEIRIARFQAEQGPGDERKRAAWRERQRKHREKINEAELKKAEQSVAEQRASALHHGDVTVTSRVTDTTSLESVMHDSRVTNPAAASPASFGDYGLRVFNKVTGMFSIPDPEKTIPALDGLYYQHGKDEEKLIAYLKPFYEAWKERRTKDGRFYSKTNCGWLYEWAVAGEIPANGKTSAPQFVEEYQ